MVIHFIRHGKLLPPFDSYDALSLSDLDDLSGQVVDPPVDGATIALPPRTIERLRKAPRLVSFSATSTRAQQTAKILLQQAERSIQAERTPLLNEVWFKPSTFVSEQEYREQGMDVVREGLFKASLANDGSCESVTAIFKRIHELDALLKDTNADHLLCITHGFFMRYLQLYYIKKATSPEAVTLDALLACTNYANSNGFEVGI